MTLQDEFKAVLSKQKTGSPVSYRDVAVAIACDEQTLLKFLTDNDYVQVYKLLHQTNAPLSIGNNAGFIPNKKRAESELHLLQVKNDTTAINDIVSNFRINLNTENYTTQQDIINNLSGMGVITMTDTGYKFNLKF